MPWPYPYGAEHTAITPSSSPNPTHQPSGFFALEKQILQISGATKYDRFYFAGSRIYACLGGAGPCLGPLSFCDPGRSASYKDYMEASRREETHKAPS